MSRSLLLIFICSFFVMVGCAKEATVVEPIEDKNVIGEGTEQAEPNEMEQVKEENPNSLSKEEYLKILNTQEEADKNKVVTDTTTIALIAEEQERYETWDKLLNEIYGVLKTQLPENEMIKLRDEQREWIIKRDETAKEASLQYKGGTMENLEYVATQATLTRERCYELVAKYMK